ncbi:MAG: L,D-transpeptidase/peptidoglycan binding protein [Clostridiales bacterium]|nr:L,D-transpeptidase/peptidoglycan binding protein [Clostridiales bacterium]
MEDKDIHEDEINLREALEEWEEAEKSPDDVPGDNEEVPENLSVENDEVSDHTSGEAGDISKDVPGEQEDSSNDVPGSAQEPASGEKKKHKKLRVVLPVVLAAVAAVYLGTSVFYRNHYLPNTVINGIDCSSKTTGELEELIIAEVNSYELKLTERGGDSEIIFGTDIGLQVVFDGTLDAILEEQQSFAWPAALFHDSNYNPGSTASYDDELLKGALASLNCMDTDQMTVTADAQIVFSEEGVYEIQPEVYGTYMELDTLAAAVDAALCSLAETVDLEESECYENPVYTENSEELTTACDEMNSLLSVNITYDMLDIGTIEISKEEMSGWITLGEDFSVSVNEEAVAAFVADFAGRYDTQYTDHTLQTTWGSAVTISNGSYGWKLDQEAETAALLEELAAGDDVVREPNYSHTAASHGENDYGDTYVEINLTAQHLYFYKDGVLIAESDFVSGNVAKGMSTPAGIYPVTYTQRNATLRGGWLCDAGILLDAV